MTAHTFTNRLNSGKTVSVTIDFAYAVGEQIEARDSRSGDWRPAVVTKLEPYRGKPGYYIAWVNPPYSEEQRRANDLPMPSSGGWTYEPCMRKRGA